MLQSISRRSFVKSATAGIGGLATAQILSGQEKTINKPLRVAVIGCGVMGGQIHIPEVCKEQIVALVDPDSSHIDKTMKRIKSVSPQSDLSKIRSFADYRVLFDKMGKELDAVIIATPNHHHALPAILAMQSGINVYVEKPMTHTLAEARMLTEMARTTGVASQLGNQGQSSIGSRLMCEYIAAGAIGQVREVHCWSNRANGFPADKTRPAATPPPKGMDWDLWIGPSASRDFHEDLHPHTWHSWREFGNGSIGNMGCHIINHPYWALSLKNPNVVEAEMIYGGNDQCWPIGTIIRWEFPARDGMDPVKLYWYDGLIKGTPHSTESVEPRWKHVTKESLRNFPALWSEVTEKYGRVLPDEGSLLVGDKGMMTIDKHGEGFRMIPEEAHRAFPRPAKTLPRVKGTHQEDFFRACRGGAPASSNFEHSGPLAEIGLLGNLAICAGEKKRIEWDQANMRCTNLPELNRYVKTEYREGWA